VEHCRPSGPREDAAKRSRGTGGASISIYRGQLDSTGNHVGISKKDLGDLNLEGHVEAL